MRTTQGGPHDYLDVDLNSIADLRRGRGGRTPHAVTSLSPKGFTSQRTIVIKMQSSIPMGDEHSPIRDLKHRWDEEDKTRDEIERQERRAFLEQEANELFAPLENYLTRLDKVLHQANAAVEIDPTWEHLDERKLRRTAKVILRETAQHLPLDLTIEGVTIFYRNRPYRFTRAIEALIPVITSDVEQFITAQSQATTPAHLALIKGST